MNEDELLRKLGQAARAESNQDEAAAFDAVATDERWARLAAGTLTAEEETELQGLAATSEEARTAYEAFRPLGSDFHAGVARAIREQATAARPAKVLPFRRIAARVGAWSAAAAAAAATMLVMVRPPPLPLYAMKVAGGAHATRSEASAAELAPGDRIQVTLRPDTQVQRAGSLAAKLFLVRGGERRPLRAEARLEPAGSVRLGATLDRDLPAGDWTLWAVVGRRGKLPGAEELPPFATPAPVRERDWVALAKTLHVGPRAP